MDTKIFQQNGWIVETILFKNEPWIIAKDVCECLGLTNTTSVVQSLESDEVTKLNLGGQKGETNFINESGLYSLIFKSRKPKAREFKKWVTSEILPSIRKTGSYSIQHSIPQTYSEALQLAADQAKQIENQNKQLKEQKPQVQFAKTIEGSEGRISMGEMAKLSGKIGRNSLFALLRRKYVLMSDNIPYQSYIDRGYFELGEKVITRTSGDHIQKITFVTGKGQLWIIKKLEEWI